MDINDYNTQLASTRKRYRDAATSLKENQENELKHIEEKNEVQRTKQRDNFLASKTELEDKVDQLGDNYNSKTRETIEQKQNEYRDRVMQQKGDYENQMAETKKEFRQRLEDLSRSYSTNTKEGERARDQFIASSEDRYKNALDSTINRYGSEANRASDNARSSQIELKDQMGQERRKLMAEHQDERQELLRNSSASSNASKGKHQEELAILRKVQDSELNSRQTHHEQTLNNQRNQQQLQNQRQRESFEDLTDKLGSSTKREIDRLRDNNSKTQLDLRDRFAKDRGAIERKLASVEESSSYLNGANADERLKKASDSRVQNIVSKMNEQAMQAKQKEDRIAADFQQELESQTIRARQEIKSKDQEINKLNGQVIGGIKERHMSDVEAFQQAQRETTSNAEESVLNARKAGKREASNLHLEYGRQINALQEDNSQVVSGLRQEQAKEQTAFYKNVQRQTRNEKIEMQDDFNHKFATKVDQLTQQISKLEQSQSDTIDHYETKIQGMKKQQIQSSVAQKLIEEDRRSEDKRTYQRSFTIQQREFDEKLKHIKRDVELQMAKIKQSNDVQVSTITRDYEQKLMRERQEHDKDFKLKLGSLEGEFMRFKSFHESQMKSIHGQYEVKMEKLRQANADANTKRAERDNSSQYNA